MIVTAGLPVFGQAREIVADAPRSIALLQPERLRNSLLKVEWSGDGRQTLRRGLGIQVRSDSTGKQLVSLSKDVRLATRSRGQLIDV